MLKLVSLEENTFQNIKCGEIFCLTSTLYNVTCLCGEKVHFDKFIIHFQQNHLQKVDFKPTDNVPCSIEEEDPIETNAEGLHADISLSELDWKKNGEIEEGNLSKIANCDEEKLLQISGVPENGVKEWQMDNFSDKSDEKEDESNLDFPSHPCTQCTRSYKTRNSLLKHVRTIHKNKLRSDVKESRSHSCTQCSRSYKTRHYLLKHIRTIHKDKPGSNKLKLEHKCDDCGEVFGSERNLRGHKWKHTGIFCEICGKSFTQTGNMMLHRIRHSGIKAHKCKECDYSFYTRKELTAHMMRHTQIFPFICEICGRRCQDRGVLTAHMRRHTGERPAKCPVCDKCFFSFHDLKVHSVTHSTERPFQCDICSATFQRKKSLRVHKKIHSKDGKKHECRVCGRTFAHSGGLNSHMRTHDATLSTSSITRGLATTVAVLCTAD